MTENPDTSAPGAESVDAQAEESLGYFLDSIGASAVMDQLSAYDKRIMADLPLEMQLQPVAMKPEATDEDRKIYSYFRSNHWFPKQRQEATIAAVKGVHETLRRASQAKSSDPEKAMTGTHSTIKRYFRDAENDVSILNTVLVPVEWEIKPDIGRLRQNYDALFVMADSLMAKESLTHHQWPRTNQRAYKERQKYWRGFMVFAAENASDEVLELAFDDLMQKARRRLSYWGDKYGFATQKVGHLLVKDVQEPEPASPPASLQETDKPADEDESFDQRLPDKARQELAEAAEEYAPKAQRIEILVQQGYPRKMAELWVLGAPAVYHDGRIVGVEPKDEKPSAEAIAKTKAGKKQNASNKPGIRRLPGYDREDDPSNPWHY